MAVGKTHWRPYRPDVPASGVVEVDDPRGDLDAGLGAGRVAVPVDVLDLDRGVERLSRGVVERRPDPAHGLHHAQAGTQVVAGGKVYSLPRSIWKITLSTSPPRVAAVIRKDAPTRAASCRSPTRSPGSSGRTGRSQWPDTACSHGVDLGHVTAPQHGGGHRVEVPVDQNAGGPALARPGYSNDLRFFGSRPYQPCSGWYGPGVVVVDARSTSAGMVVHRRLRLTHDYSGHLDASTTYEFLWMSHPSTAPSTSSGLAYTSLGKKTSSSPPWRGHVDHPGRVDRTYAAIVTTSASSGPGARALMACLSDVNAPHHTEPRPLPP